MLAFAETAWHVCSALLVFVFGLCIALVQRRFFRIGHRRAILLYLWHTAFCLFFLLYSLTNVADASSYFRVSLTYDLGMGLGTHGIYFLTSLFSAGLGLSYGGTFLVFNIFGYIGMLALASALQEITRGTSTFARSTCLILILLPGLSFWSSAIGKDALTFMAAGLATWGALDLARRYPAFVVAAFAFLLARPHMAGIFLTATVLSLLLSSSIGVTRKIALLLVTLPSATTAVAFGAQFAGLGEADSADDVADFFAERQGHNLEGGSSVDIRGMSIMLRVLTYLFRPLFFDAGGVLGLIVSFENLLLAFMVFSTILLRILGRKSNLNTFATLFFVIFAAAALLVLANTTANLGIAIRQKWMFLPMLLVLAVSFCFRPRTR